MVIASKLLPIGPPKRAWSLRYSIVASIEMDGGAERAMTTPKENRKKH